MRRCDGTLPITLVDERRFGDSFTFDDVAAVASAYGTRSAFSALFGRGIADFCVGTGDRGRGSGCAGAGRSHSRSASLPDRIERPLIGTTEYPNSVYEEAARNR